MKKGFYRHYKGEIYCVVGFATHTEDEETLVIYTDALGGNWARPKTMFMGLHEGKSRFEYCKNQAEAQAEYYLPSF